MLTDSEKAVWRTVNRIRASTAFSPCTRNRLYSCPSRPNATITRNIEKASWMMLRDSDSRPRTVLSLG